MSTKRLRRRAHHQAPKGVERLPLSLLNDPGEDEEGALDDDA